MWQADRRHLSQAGRVDISPDYAQPEPGSIRPYGANVWEVGSRGRTRTCDPAVNSRLLYH